MIFPGFGRCLLFLLRTFIVAYLFKVYKSSSPYNSLVMTHAALKWFHSFGLSNGANPLNSSISHNLLEALVVISQSLLKRRLYLLRLLRVLSIRLLVLLLILRTYALLVSARWASVAGFIFSL